MTQDKPWRLGTRPVDTCRTSLFLHCAITALEAQSGRTEGRSIGLPSMRRRVEPGLCPTRIAGFRLHKRTSFSPVAKEVPFMLCERSVSCSVLLFAPSFFLLPVRRIPTLAPRVASAPSWSGRKVSALRPHNSAIRAFLITGRAAVYSINALGCIRQVSCTGSWGLMQGRIPWSPMLTRSQPAS
jgi:hypothetical protein